MTTQYSIPPFRDLPPSRLIDRKVHLMEEIARERKLRFTLPAFSLRHPRATLIATSACAAAALAALAVTLSASPPSTSRSPFLVQALRGPVWSSYAGGVNWGGGPLNLGCAKIVQLAFGCKGILTVPSTSQQQHAIARSSSQLAPTDVGGGSAAQQKLLQSIMEGMRPNAITSVAIVPSHAGVLLRMKAADASAETLWQESLVAAAFRDRAKATGSDASVSLENGDSNGALIPPGPRTALPAAKPGQGRAARERVEAAAARTSASLTELVVYEPSGVAVAATLRTSDPAKFLVREMPAFLASLGDRWHDYDGVYIRLVDGSGITVWETSSVARTSSGSVGSREDLTGCSPVANWGPTPPPCPEK